MLNYWYEKVIVIAAILTLVSERWRWVWLKTRLDAQTAAGVAQEQAEVSTMSDLRRTEMLELVNPGAC